MTTTTRTTRLPARNRVVHLQGRGVKRAILLRKIGLAPAGPDDMEEVAADTATPYLAQYETADAGKAAHWALCWENSTGQRGPCSAVTSWTIPG